jgi:DNA-binding beta-propeller fold protein YncE
MGGISVHEINLATFTQKKIPVGLNPRAVVLSPDNSKMYVTLNSAGKVIAWDLKKSRAIGSVKTGEGARSLAISSDGSALFVVNYDSDTVAKVSTSDLSIIQTVNPCIRLLQWIDQDLSMSVATTLPTKVEISSSHSQRSDYED